MPDVVLERERSQPGFTRFLQIAYGEHCQVVALFRPFCETPDFIPDALDQRLGVRSCLTFKYLYHTRFRELLARDVLRLGHAVGIQEQRGAGRQVALLRLEIDAFEHAHREVCDDRQVLRISRNDDGVVVACVAVSHMSGLKIQHSDEEGHEHIGLVVAAGCVVDGPHDDGGVVVVLGEQAEQRVRHGHQHS